MNLERFLGASIVGFGLLIGVPAVAQSITCPSPHPNGGADMVKDTSTQLEETGSFLASSNDSNSVTDAAADLRSRYPGVSDAEIVNYLVAAYCPQIAKLNGLTAEEQTARVKHFSSQVEALIH